MSIVSEVGSEVLHVVGDRVQPIVEGSQSGGAFELFVVEGDAGSGPPPHAHPWLETYYVLDGTVLVEIEGDRALASAGDRAVVPAGAVHRFEIASPTARFIVATSGDRTARFFRDLSATAPGAPTPENLPAIIEVAKRNGLTSPLF